MGAYTPATAPAAGSPPPPDRTLRPPPHNPPAGAVPPLPAAPAPHTAELRPRRPAHILLPPTRSGSPGSSPARRHGPGTRYSHPPSIGPGPPAGTAGPLQKD